MIKKIIMSVLCIALLTSSFSGCAFAAAKKSEPNAPAADGAGKGNAEVEGVSVVGGEGSLLSYNGEYILTGNVTITKENASKNPTYQALLSVFDDKHLDTERKILNGQGYTISTEIPLFKQIGNCIIKNLNVVSNGITLTENNLVPIIGSSNNVGVGVIAGVTHNPVVFENVNVDADITFKGNIDTRGLFIGGFVGYGGVYRMTNCKNDGNVTADLASCGQLSIGGLIGFKEDSCAVLIENCINNGDLVGKKGANVKVDMYIGGIAGRCSGRGDVINSTMNTGNITAVQNTRIHTRIGGIVGHYHTIIPTDCMNLGDISVTYTGSEAFKSYTEFAIGGILGTGYNDARFTRCFNAGDITCKTTGGAIWPGIGGIVSWRAGGTGIFVDCVNIGDLPSDKSVFVAGGITAHNDMTQTKLNNCYTVAFEGEWTPYYNQNNNGKNSDRYFITVPASVDTYIEKVKTEQINDAKTVIKTILEMVEYDDNFAHNKDDGKTLQSTIIG